MIEEVLEKNTGIILSCDRKIKCISSIDGIKKFDICLMNPPYSRNLHLKFLKKAIEVSDNVVSIQPANWIKPLQYRKPTTEEINDIKNYEFV